MKIPFIAQWAKKKGIGLVATGDWTHPMWFREIQKDLEEVGNGLLRLKDDASAGSSFDSSRQGPDPFSFHHGVGAKAVTGLEKIRRPALPLFLLATEVSCIFSQGGKGRRIHILIWVPSIGSAEKINKQMTKQGCNLLSDGRPIIGLSAIQVSELVLSLEPKAIIIAAHCWTPWFSLYGSMSGFDSIDEAFGPFAKNIYAVETGLSSSPAMNWRIKELDNRSIVSFSDAHSGPKLGREATVFDVADGQLSYDAIYQAILSTRAVEGSSFAAHPSNPSGNVPPAKSTKDVTVLEKTRPHAPHDYNGQPTIDSRIAYTIEFYPEEGKYHYSGHRACGIRWGPKETREKGTACPVCGKSLTQGVEQRVEELAGRSEADLKLSVEVDSRNRGTLIPGIAMTGSKTFPHRPPFVMLVPLQEIIAEAIRSPVSSVKVQPIYERLVDSLGGEFSVLLKSSVSSISRIAGERIAEAVDKVRKGDIVIEPGYDGVFGVVKIWGKGENKESHSHEQLHFL